MLRYSQYFLFAISLTPTIVQYDSEQRDPTGLDGFSYGRVEYFIHLRLSQRVLPKSARRHHHLIAAITPCKLTNVDSADNPYYKSLRSGAKIVDANNIKCLVGRIEDRGNIALIRQQRAFQQVIAGDDNGDADEYNPPNDTDL